MSLHAARSSRSSASALVGCNADDVLAGPSGSSARHKAPPRPSVVALASSAVAVSLHAHSRDAKSSRCVPAYSSGVGTSPARSRSTAARAVPSSQATTRFNRNVTGSPFSSLAAMRTRADSGGGSGAGLATPVSMADAGSPPAACRSAMSKRADASDAAPSDSIKAPSPRRNQTSDHVPASASNKSAACASSAAFTVRCTHDADSSRSSNDRSQHASSNAAAASLDATSPSRTRRRTSAKANSSRRSCGVSSVSRSLSMSGLCSSGFIWVPLSLS